jgi:hypothetical protein
MYNMMFYEYKQSLISANIVSLYISYVICTILYNYCT